MVREDGLEDVAETEVYISCSSFAERRAVSRAEYCDASKGAVDVPLGYGSALGNVLEWFLQLEEEFTFVRSIISIVSPRRRNCRTLVALHSWLQIMEYAVDKSKESSSSSSDARRVSTIISFEQYHSWVGQTFAS